jgi:hypothetical protein
MHGKVIFSAAAAAIVLAGAGPGFAKAHFKVVPFEFDPDHTHLVTARWLHGFGCPVGAFADSACTEGDARDKLNQGLLLSKNGPTAANAAAGAELKGVRGISLTELGYDIRKPPPELAAHGPRGSHCDNGSPRFNIALRNGAVFFIGCASPPATTDVPGEGWHRLRWGALGVVAGFSSSCPDPNVPCPIVGPVESIDILFDDGRDAGTDLFGMADLDNVDVNGTLVGRGPNDDEDEGGGEDDDQDDFEFHHSPAHPETSGFEFRDQAKGVSFQGVGGVQSATYNGACATYVGNALMNGNPGYVVTFASCDLSALAGGIGNFNITATGPLGFLYQKSATISTGFVALHPH